MNNEIYRIQAKNNLEYLRSGSGSFATTLKNMRNALRLGGFTLGDIGGREQEIEVFKKKYFAKEAQRLFNKIKSDRKKIVDNLSGLGLDLNELKKMMEDCKFSPKDFKLGSDEFEREIRYARALNSALPSLPQ